MYIRLYDKRYKVYGRKKKTAELEKFYLFEYLQILEKSENEKQYKFKFEMYS